MARQSSYRGRCCRAISGTDVIARPKDASASIGPYSTLVPTMFSKSETFYQQMVDAYYAQELYGMREPLSVIRTSAMEA